MFNVNDIVTSFDGKNFWPYKIVKFTEKTATVVSVQLNGKESGEPKTRRIKFHTGKPSILVHDCEEVYLTRPYQNELFLASSDI